MSKTPDAVQQPPNYDVTLDADELLSDLVEMSVSVASERDEYRRWWREELDRAVDPHSQYQYWVLEKTGELDALGRAIAALHPENHHVMVRCCRNADGTVDVRAYLHWLSRKADSHHEVVNERGRAPLSSNMETGFCRVISLVRDEYGVGWPRMDEHGSVLEEDMP